MSDSKKNEFYLEGKYSNDLLEFGDHAIKGQGQMEKRHAISYNPTYKKYVIESIQFNKQYNSFYEVRLKEMRPLLIKAAQQKWGKNISILKIDEIRDLQVNQDCVIIGTIYKDLSLFKSILNEKVSSAFNPQLIGTQFLPKSSIHGPLSQENDPIILEDSTTRVTLKNFTIPIVTGVVASIRGKMDDNGDFEVSDTCFLHDSIQVLSIPPPSTEPKDPYLLCISGLSVGQSISMKVHILFEYLASQLGFIEDVKLASHIGRVVFLGNSVNLPREPFQRIRQDTNELNSPMSCVGNLDLLLSQILPTVPVTLMPGPSDPLSMLIPQQPFHPSLLQHCTYHSFLLTQLALLYSSLECSTNPYEAIMNDKRVLMTSGQNIQDISRQITPTPSILDCMALTLQWGVLFPTNPNTCPGIPYDTVDPFIIHELPDVYVVGNQPSYEVGRREIGGKEITLIALPSFASTGMVSMINLRTLDVNSMNFNVDSIETTSMEIEEEKEEEEDVVIDEDIANDEEYYVYYKQTNK